jgi:hypothetical protein
MDMMIDSNPDDLEDASNSHSSNVESSCSNDVGFDNKGSEDTSLSYVAKTFCPSHILQDGSYVHLPPPSEFERTRFFERSVAKHGLLHDDIQSTKRSREGNHDDETAEFNKKSKVTKDAPKIHPLALASARIQSHGINELNRAINLQTLVETGEYFGLSNIVDPSYDRSAVKSSSKGENADIGSGSVSTGSAVAVATTTSLEYADEARVRASYVLQRKHDIFHEAASSLNRHRRRLVAAIVSQRQIDTRWRELRPFWRLVAPEHGTRALPHAVKTTEVICADVDVYLNISSHVGRLASHVPRYATIELLDNYNVTEDVKYWLKEKLSNDNKIIGETATNEYNQQMAIENTSNSGKVKPSSEVRSSDDLKWMKKPNVYTKALPYLFNDRVHGKQDAGFDSAKVTMLTLQFSIEKPSTGYFESVCLEPISTTLFANAVDNAVKHNDLRDDEQLLLFLQHSLFCAKLFESMRRELAPDTEGIGQIRTTSTQSKSVAWLAGHSNQNFLPPPSMMIGLNKPGLLPLSIVHVHEGDFKVLLDCEYSLNVRLVESDFYNSELTEDYTWSRYPKTKQNSDSGSQTPAQIRTLCKALLLHAQQTYHRHSIESESNVLKENKEMNQKPSIIQKENPNLKFVSKVTTKESNTSPHTLQNCISIGAKMLFESRIRKTLRMVKDWLESRTSSIHKETLNVEWLVLTVFDLASQFTVSFRSWYIDASIVCDELTVTSFGNTGEYRKVKFHSDKQFELYLKTALRRALANGIE